MSPTDLIYLSMLVGAIPLGHLVKISGSPARKEFLCMVAGISLSLALVGRGILHSFVAVAGTYLIVILLGKRRCEWTAFSFVFGYLFFFRTCAYYGFEKPPPHSNAIQLLITLRCCTFPFEAFDTSESGEEDSKKAKLPSFYEFLSYAYCYCGLTTGPYFRYKTFKDMLNQEHPEEISTVIPAIRNLKTLLFYGVIYLFLNEQFPISHIGSQEYIDHPMGVVYRLLYLVPAFIGFRWRFYIGWLLAESSAMSLGLGAYPFYTDPRPGLGPTKSAPEENGAVTGSETDQIEQIHRDTHRYVLFPCLTVIVVTSLPSFETIHNIKIFEVEFSPSMTYTMKNWNLTIQWWMSNFVHRKLPFKNRNLRMFITLLVSAFWHGVAPGYYLTFLMVPFVVIAEVHMAKAIKPYLSPKLCYYYDWLSWFCHYRSMEYLGCGFMLLQLEPCIAAWKSVYYIGHIFIVIFILLPMFIPKKHVSDTEPEKKMS